MGAVFYLGAGWPQWKLLGIPGTHRPLKRRSWLNRFESIFLQIFKNTRLQELERKVSTPA